MASTFTIWYTLETLVAASKGTFPNHVLTLQFQICPLKQFGATLQYTRAAPSGNNEN